MIRLSLIRNKPFRFLTSLAVVVLASFPNSDLSAAATTTTIRVSYPQLNGRQTPLWNIPENKLDQKADLRGKVLGVITKGISSDHVSITMLIIIGFYRSWKRTDS